MSQPALLMLLERLLWPVPRVRWEVARSLAHLIRDGESEAADALLKWLRSRKLESDTLIGLGIIDAFDLSSFFDGDRVATAVSAPSIASDYLIRRNFEVASGLSPFRYQVSPGPRATLPSHQEAWFSQYKYQAVPPYFSLILAQLEDASEYPFLSRWEHDWRWIQATYPRPKPNPFFFHREHETGQLDLGLTEVYRSSYLRTFAHAVLLHHITSDEAEGKALHPLTMNRGLADVEPIDRPSWARAPVPLSGHHTHRVVRELWASARAAAGPSEVPAALRILTYDADGFTEIDMVQTVGRPGFAAGPVEAAAVGTVVLTDQPGVMAGSVGPDDPRIVKPIRRPTQVVNIVMPEHAGSVHRELVCAVRLASPELFRIDAEVQCGSTEVRLETGNCVFSRWVHWYSDWEPAMHSDIESTVCSMTTVAGADWARLTSRINTQTSILAKVRTGSRAQSYSSLKTEQTAFWMRR